MEKQKADQIITEYLPKIYGFAMKKSFFYDEAEDLCADIVKEVYLSLLKSSEIINLEGYIWRISEHTYSKYVTSKKKHLGISIDGMEIPFEQDFSLEDSEDEIIRLRQEIAFLTKKRREIVYSFYYENKTISAISKETGIPVGTVKWHLNKARNELKEGFQMERKIGKLGLRPIETTEISHSGCPGSNGGPEYYLGDKLNLNIVYSVYHTPKTKEEIAEELGMTPVYIEDKIDFLTNNGFLMPISGNKYTTYVKFSPDTYSLELKEKQMSMKLKIAEMLAKEYAPKVREAISDITDVYIPGGNRELLEAAAILYGVINKCRISLNKDLSKYEIKTTDGGKYIVQINQAAVQSDPEYKPKLNLPSYWSCGNMTRISDKYPAVYSWSVDTKYCSREGGWRNNLTADYEYLYEFMTDAISDTTANSEKFKRLKERNYLTSNNKINIMLVKGTADEFFAKIPPLGEELKKEFADFALESALAETKNHPPHMHDLVISWGAEGFVSNMVAIMVMDILYGNDTFKPLTENEKVTSNLIMFSDILPKE